VKLVIFGLSVSSSWGNGHATLWRGLIAALGRLGHDVLFFERDVAYYASHRDLDELPGGQLVLYRTWDGIALEARRAVTACDAAIVTSYCPDGIAACELVLSAPAPRTLFYDLDTPVTLERLARGERVEYLPPDGLGGFDLVLSYTGGATLDELRTRLGARAVAPLYGSVDPSVHRPAPRDARFDGHASYLGTYAADRQRGVETLLLDPARRLPAHRFVVGGPMYPPSIAWPPNVRVLDHVAPGCHAAFYGSSPLTLSLTRASMAERGWCPSGRLFEAAACGVPVLSDWWPGLDDFFIPGEEILVAKSSDDALVALTRPRRELARIGRAAQARALSCHTAARRAEELIALIDEGGAHVGHHSGSRHREPDSAVGVLEGAASRR
jgi:spore maturation protein CgeB